MAEALQAAIERLRSEMLHVPLCPVRPCTCQRFADLALVVAAAQTGAREPSYVPQDIAAECLQMLTAAGMGKRGKANTLWAMVLEATQSLANAGARARAIEEALSRLVSRIPEGDPPDKEDWHHIYVGKDEAEYARAALLPPEAPRAETEEEARLA